MKTTNITPSEIVETSAPIPSATKLAGLRQVLEFIKSEAPISMRQAFFTVLGLHLLVLVGVMVFSFNTSAQATQLAEDKKYVMENAPFVGVDTSETPINKPSTKLPKKSAVGVDKKPGPKPKIITKVPANPHPAYPQFAREYVVRKGDTFSKIVRKYNVDATKFKVLNGIKDENKIVIGQKLKLL